MPYSIQALKLLRRSTGLLTSSKWLIPFIVSTSLALTATDATAGFSPEELAGFEVTELQATITTALPKEKVIEIVDPQGHTEILTVGFDLTPLHLQAGDWVKLGILDGLIVNLEPSKNNELSFNREDIILPMRMGRMKKGMRVALASGTARVIRIDRQDRSISLMGPLGGIHNLDVLRSQGKDIVPGLQTGDLVDFRMIQPMAITVSRLDQPPSSDVRSEPTQEGVGRVNPSASLKAELLESFEFSHLQGTVIDLKHDGQAFSLRGPEGHTITVSAGVDLAKAHIRPGDRISVDLMEGLVVDLNPAPKRDLASRHEDVVLATPFGPIPKGTRVTMVTGTAELVRIARNDHSISLKGDRGGVHNLDLRRALETEVIPDLRVGDVVAFRLIQPIAYAVRRESNP